jgi:hypothetical protein
MGLIKLIAKDNFTRPGLARPVRAGEVIDVDMAEAAELITAGLALPAPVAAPGVRENMVKEPKERRGKKKG